MGQGAGAAGGDTMSGAEWAFCYAVTLFLIGWVLYERFRER